MFQAVVELVPGARGVSLPSRGDRRTSDRAPVELAANVRARGSRLRLRAEVVDISTDGCRILAQEYAPGDTVLIALAHLAPIAGRVCWAREGAIGVQFETRLHPAIVRHLAALGRA
ncbi:hypothetical protein FHS95_000823 [Sphingomonas naasensis]|nr:PilZ domain-containing protein [Sphingomonas naasensis]NIJ19154.1 hypothetical protein [Sphingomonas naasensis]